MENEKEFLEYLKKEKIKTFQTKSMSKHLKEEMNIPKIRVKIWVSILKTNGLIVRKSESGYCKTTCASCYEYGCDAGEKPPINFWEIVEEEKTKINTHFENVYLNYTNLLRTTGEKEIHTA